MFKNLWNSLVSLVKRVITYFFPEHPELVEEIKGDEELVEEIDPDELNPSMEIMDVKEASTVIVDNESGERVTRIYTAGDETREIYQPENTKDFNVTIRNSGKHDNVFINNNCYENTMNCSSINGKVGGDIYVDYDIIHIFDENALYDIVFIYKIDCTELLEIRDWKSNKIYWRKEGFDPSHDKEIIYV